MAPNEIILRSINLDQIRNLYFKANLQVNNLEKDPFVHHFIKEFKQKLNIVEYLFKFFNKMVN